MNKSRYTLVSRAPTARRSRASERLFPSCTVPEIQNDYCTEMFSCLQSDLIVCNRLRQKKVTDTYPCCSSVHITVEYNLNKHGDRAIVMRYQFTALEFFTISLYQTAICFKVKCPHYTFFRYNVFLCFNSNNSISAILEFCTNRIRFQISGQIVTNSQTTTAFVYEVHHFV